MKNDYFGVWFIFQIISSQMLSQYLFSWGREKYSQFISVVSK